MVHYADKMVGRILEKLEEHHLREKTLVLFTGDNGTAVDIVSQFQGKLWKGGKGQMTDRGTRVPLIASWPGTIPSGRVNQDLIDFSDVLPTLAAAANVEIPSHLKLDGHSFLPQLKGESGNPREWVYCWYFRDGEPVAEGKTHQAGESARTHRYKLYLDGGFFDLLHNPDEHVPLALEKLTSEQKIVRDRLQKAINEQTRPGFYPTVDEAKD